jgi:hypothetical protein
VCSFDSADGTLFLFSVSAVRTAVLFFFCAGSTGGVIGDTDVDFLCACSTGDVGDNTAVGTGVLVFFVRLSPLDSADGTFFLFYVSAVGTAFLFFVGGACTGGELD